MQTFTIKDIENLTGIKAHTLRIWEQRYGLIMPGRKESKRREYTNEDLKQILKVSFLYHKGYKISKIAALKQEEINSISLDYDRHNSFDVFINQFIEAALDFNDEAFSKILNTVIRQIGFEKGFLNVVYPFLNKMGMLWITGNVLPAQEHFSSNLIRNEIILAIDELAYGRNQDSELILVFSPSGEFHEIPLLLSHYFLKKNGYRVAYFGINTDIEDIKFFSNINPSFQLFFHLLTSLTAEEPAAYINSLCEAFPGKKITAAGPAFKEFVGHPEQVKVILTLKDLNAATF